MASPILQKVPLGFQWPTIDPFLFCVHHDDAYPQGNGRFGPAAPLTGRNIGADFEGVDGWRMYHGSTVPGFPQHPHRGFETVTYARQGFIDHSDSMGAAARFGTGDVQWMTAGRGVVHSEMFPLLSETATNPVELFQIWLNLPAADKMVDPHFTMLWDENIPRVDVSGVDGTGARITVIAGSLDGVSAPPPPPNSWANRADAELAIWHVHLDAGGSWRMPAARNAATVRVVYVFGGSADGEAMAFEGEAVAVNTGVVVHSEVAVTLSSAAGAEALVLQGRPIGEPVAQHGPFVMNTREEIEQAFSDYRRTGFGGWPWPADDPVHGADPARFARHASGRVERPAAITAPAAAVAESS
jgi:redox-sensitive bicupin YhaK (pirin superfamily)